MITIVDSGGANISSVRFALDRTGQKAELTADIDIISRAERVILPGVGAASGAMAILRERGLDDCLRGLTCPVLGICLGMQLLFRNSEEGCVDMLGIINGPVKKFLPEPKKTIPHMGWNTVSIGQNVCPLVKNVPEQSYFYFVHSYYAPVGDYTVGECTYFSNRFSAIVAQDNFMGCQFHPERSGPVGGRILENFARM